MELQNGRPDNTEADVNIVYQRITGIYGGKVPGIIEFWTIEGKVIYNT